MFSLTVNQRDDSNSIKDILARLTIAKLTSVQMCNQRQVTPTYLLNKKVCKIHMNKKTTCYYVLECLR